MDLVEEQNGFNESWKVDPEFRVVEHIQLIARYNF